MEIPVHISVLPYIIMIYRDETYLSANKGKCQLWNWAVTALDRISSFINLIDFPVRP